MPNDLQYFASPVALLYASADKFMLLHVQSMRCFSVDDIGARMWQLLTQYRTVDAVVAKLTEEFDAPEDLLRADVTAFVNKFASVGLLVHEAPETSNGDAASAVDLYLDLLRDTITGVAYEDPPRSPVHIGDFKIGAYLPKVREFGRDVPSRALTLIGTRRMDNLRRCVEAVLRDGVPGDLMETGVWRGGATIYMRGILRAHGDATRSVWVVDSFEGLPAVDLERYAADEYFKNSAGVLAVSLDEVQGNFARFGLLDERVRFLKGWFRDTLPSAPVDQLAVLRLDGDLYESTMDVLTNLYPRVSPGGFVIIDDYCLPPCRAALADYRAAHGIEEPIVDIDGWSVYWRKAGAGAAPATGSELTDIA